VGHAPIGTRDRAAAQTAAHTDAMPMTIDTVRPILNKRVTAGDIT
jgi:hypothetical protein